ncbi:DUF5333 domain-containing protein [Roseovarius amoyensis]|uniref:DUF5333 domain-containing protein n=1 Tax=Roseovarius amoyensis TaxID=2211448 RepID=UPI001EF8E4B0|nr:DUF5333 domain-containing protein [Roseovarius amoyensis]
MTRHETSPMHRTVALILGLAVAGGGAAASAESGLQAETDINAGLLDLAVADKIRRECGNIGTRFFRAQSYVNDLKKMAEKRGYSRDEIDAYINNDVEEAKMREKRNAYFEARGASNLDAASLCVLGRAEIAQGSRIGRLLKAK